MEVFHVFAAGSYWYDNDTHLLLLDVAMGTRGKIFIVMHYLYSMTIVYKYEHVVSI